MSMIQCFRNTKKQKLKTRMCHNRWQHYQIKANKGLFCFMLSSVYEMTCNILNYLRKIYIRYHKKYFQTKYHLKIHFVLNCNKNCYSKFIDIPKSFLLFVTTNCLSWKNKLCYYITGIFVYSTRWKKVGLEWPYNTPPGQ